MISSDRLASVYSISATASAGSASAKQIPIG
jgi:hypothetical protein